jgi:hypothetical protein
MEALSSTADVAGGIDRLGDAVWALPKPAPRPSIWRRLVATLVLDNWLQTQVAGARSGGNAHHRILYRSGSVEIDLEVVPSKMFGRLCLFGQVTTGESDLRHIWVIAEGPSGHLESDLDHFGQFSLDGVVPGVHQMEIGFAYKLIAIPAVRF